MVGLRPSLSESWAPDVDPARVFGELDRDPLRTLVQPGNRGPGRAMGEARVLGGLEQHVELPVGGQPQPGPGQLLSVPIEDPPPLGQRKPQQKSREIVSERSNTHVIPVDELDTGSLRRDRNERVLSPQIAVQERVRSARFLENFRPPGHVGEQGMHPPKQTIAERPQLSWRTFAVKPFEATNRIADIRGEESEAKVAAVLADLGQQRVSGATNVQLGDEVCRRRDAWPVALSFERVVAEILINLPEPPTLAIRRDGKQRRTVIAESQRGGPALGAQAGELADRGLATLEDDRARSVASLESQPVDSALH